MEAGGRKRKVRVNSGHHQHHRDKAHNSGTVPPIPGWLATLHKLLILNGLWSSLWLLSTWLQSFLFFNRSGKNFLILFQVCFCCFWCLYILQVRVEDCNTWELSVEGLLGFSNLFLLLYTTLHISTHAMHCCYSWPHPYRVRYCLHQGLAILYTENTTNPTAFEWGENQPLPPLDLITVTQE